MPNKHRCPVCNKFMERDDLTGVVIFRCPDRCKQKVNNRFETVAVIDVEATDKLWDKIDKQNEIGKYARDKINPYPI